MTLLTFQYYTLKEILIIDNFEPDVVPVTGLSGVSKEEGIPVKSQTYMVALLFKCTFSVNFSNMTLYYFW